LLLAVGTFGLAIFVALVAPDSMTVVLDIEVQTSTESLGQIFFRRSGASVNPVDACGFRVRPGRQQHACRVPIEIDALRVDPLTGPGVVRVRSIALRAWGLPFATWQGASFGAWRPLHDLTVFEIASDGALEMQATGSDPYFQIEGLTPGRTRRAWAAAWAVACGLLLGLGQWWLMRAGADTPAFARSAPRARWPRRAEVWLMVGSVVVSLAASAGIYRLWERWRRPAAPIAALGTYDTVLVDAAGRTLGDKPAAVKLVLDPFSLYRNLPNQRSAHFSVDAHGYRGGFDPADPRPRVLVLGGSAAFGYGLASDRECFSAQLDALDATRRYVNGGVIGFLSGQELAELLHHGDDLPAAGYVVFDGWNELFAQLFPDPDARAYGFNRQILASIETRLRLLVRQTQAARPPVPVVPDAGANAARILNAYTANLARMARVARAQGAFLLVVFQPQLGSKRVFVGAEAGAWQTWQSAYPETHADFVRQYQTLLAGARAFCDRQGIATLDLEQASTLRDSTQELFLDTVHLSAAGHRLVAEAIARRLRDGQS
jgi:lysophospholipase L1-like esterase